MNRWGLCVLLAALIVLTAACGTTTPNCGADLCVTAVRALRPGDGSLTLLFELTTASGNIDEANPPTFAAGLNVMLADQTEDRRYLDRTFEATDFTCRVGTDIPGAEGRRAAACLLTLGPEDFDVIPEPGVTVLLNFYNDTLPIDLRNLAIP